MKRAEILDEAKRIVGGEREDTYGGPEDSFNIIAKLWTVYIAERAKVHDVGPGHFSLHAHDVAIMMMMLKASRLVTAPGHKDSWIDAAGYVACGGEIATRGQDNGAQ